MELTSIEWLDFYLYYYTPPFALFSNPIAISICQIVLVLNKITNQAYIINTLK